MDYSKNECQAHEFLELIYGNVPDGALEVTYIAPDGIDLRPHTIIQWRDLPLGDIDPAMPNVHMQNQRGYSCYFGVTVRKAAKPQEQRTNSKTGQLYWMQPRGNERDALYLTTLWCDIDMKDFDGDNGAKERKPIIFFANDKQMVCNKTNGTTLGEMFGNETDDWIGKEITLIVQSVDFAGKSTPAIRIKNLNSKDMLIQDFWKKTREMGMTREEGLAHLKEFNQDFSSALAALVF